MKLKGYLRKDGKVGFRNYVVVLPSAGCANDVVERIGRMYKNVKVLSHRQGCAQLGDDKEQSRRTLVGLGSNPNIGAVLVVGMGCESITAPELAHEISKSKKYVEALVVEKEGGSLVDTITKGNRILQSLTEKASTSEEVECGLDSLTLGIKCGLTDTTSGLSANPATGIVADMIIQKGGTVVFGETPEVIGTEHILAKRVINKEVKDRLFCKVKECEERVKASGMDIRGANPAPGNIKGGITSIEEKSLGAIRKAGSQTLQGVLNYGEIPSGKGLYFMDGPGRTPEALTGLLSVGAQVIIFPTGGGSPAGTPLSPVIKVTGNPETARARRDHIDVDVSDIIEGKCSIEEAGNNIYKKLLEVLSGHKTKAEAFEYGYISIWNIGAHM